MNRRGFTIIELIIVITILGILLILGVVNLVGAQANARDDQRKAGISAIDFNLETYYQSGNDTSIVFGRYPSTDLIGQETTFLRDIDPKSLIAPGGASPSSIIAATNNLQTVSTVLPAPTTGQYVYQPIAADGTLCLSSTECHKFNLYYRLEVDNNIYMVMSKNQ